MVKIPVKPERPPRPRIEARRARVRAEILDAAREILLERGVDGVTIAAVAARLGLTKPAVYHYFASLDALLAELVVGLVARECETLARSSEEASAPAAAPGTFLRAALAHYATHVDEFRMLYAVLQVHAAPEVVLRRDLRARVYPISGRMYDALERRLSEGQADGSIAADLPARDLAVSLHLAALGFGLMNGLMLALDDTMKQPIARLLDTLIAALEHGLAPRAPAAVAAAPLSRATPRAGSTPARPTSPPADGTRSRSSPRTRARRAARKGTGS